MIYVTCITHICNRALITKELFLNINISINNNRNVLFKSHDSFNLVNENLKELFLDLKGKY